MEQDLKWRIMHDVALLIWNLASSVIFTPQKSIMMPLNMCYGMVITRRRELTIYLFQRPLQSTLISLFKMLSFLIEHSSELNAEKGM